MNIRIATRRSPLAQAQTRLIAEQLRALDPAVQVELVTMTTRGDRRSGPLQAVGGKGLFTAELESALLDGRVDLAVHSAKDMPVKMDPRLEIVATPARGDPRDALVLADGISASEGSKTRIIGTSSPRRAVCIYGMYPNAEIRPIRGNVQTRLSRAVGPGADLDAVVLAMAGLARSDLLTPHRQRILPLSTEAFVPAACQGTLVVQMAVRQGVVSSVRDLVQRIDDPDTHQALLAERSVICALQADCRSPVGVYVRRGPDGTWAARAMVGSVASGRRLDAEQSGPSAAAAAQRVLGDLQDGGAEAILSDRPD